MGFSALNLFVLLKVQQQKNMVKASKVHICGGISVRGATQVVVIAELCFISIFKGEH